MNLRLQEAITTMTYRQKQISTQKFYKVAIPDFLPLAVGEGAFSKEILYGQEVSATGNFEDGLLNQGKQNNQLMTGEVGMNYIKSPVLSWANQQTWTYDEIGYAMQTNNWDLVDAKLRLQKRTWDLGIQRIAFLGSVIRPNVTGLLNNPTITNDTTTITKPISSMTAAEIRVFVSVLLGIYNANTNNTELPDRFVIPLKDMLGLATPFSDLNPISLKKVLEDAFKEATENPNFQVRGVAYGSEDFNNLGVNRYALYKYDEESIVMEIPLDYMTFDPNSLNNYQINGVAMGQFTGVTWRRPQEGMYFSY